MGKASKTNQNYLLIYHIMKTNGKMSDERLIPPVALDQLVLEIESRWDNSSKRDQNLVSLSFFLSFFFNQI